MNHTPPRPPFKRAMHDALGELEMGSVSARDASGDGFSDCMTLRGGTALRLFALSSLKRCC